MGARNVFGTTAAAAGHVTACSLSPECVKLFLFFSLATFSLFSLATSTTATHSLRQSGCNLSRQEENCCANSTSYSHHSTKQAPCCYRSSGKDAGRSLMNAIETWPCKQTPNIHASSPNCDKSVLDGPGEARQGYSTTQESDTTLPPMSE